MTTSNAPGGSWRRWLSVGLVLYGLAGIVLAAGGAVLVSSSFRGVERITDAIIEQRNALVLSLEATASVVESAATSTGAIDDLLDNATGAVADAATLTRSLADAAEDVAGAATFELLGQQPLAGVAESFSQVAADARSLAEQLDQASATLGGTTGETGRLRGALLGVSDQIRAFGESLSGSDVLDDLEAGFNAPRLVLYGLLAWLSVQAAAAMVLGVVLLQQSRRPPPASAKESSYPF